MGAPEPITAENALTRAALWLGVLVEALECEPDETTIKLKAAGEVVASINLGDDLRAFTALGARSDMLEAAS